MDNITHKIMVMSNKGGVGKSTITALLAEALAIRGNQVGILDIDIHGPSQHKIFNLQEKLQVNSQGNITPCIARENLKIISTAGILDQEEQALIWRGPKKTGIIQQFIKDVAWGNLDFLMIDAPPGTGDEPLTVAQLIPLTGIIIVTTPQELALLDSKKAITFANQLATKIIGVIVNMTSLECPHCGKAINLFDNEAQELPFEIPILGKLHFEHALLQSFDQGKSFLREYSTSKLAQAIYTISDQLAMA